MMPGGDVDLEALRRRQYDLLAVLNVDLQRLDLEFSRLTALKDAAIAEIERINGLMGNGGAADEAA